MQIARTVKLRIYPTIEQIALFRELTAQYRDACNFIAQYVFENNFDLNAFRLSKTLYRTLRNDFNLRSQMAQSSARTVVAAYKTVKTQLSQKPYCYKDADGNWQRVERTLEWLQKPIEFKKPMCDLIRKNDFSFVTVKGAKMVSINTLQGRVKVRYNDKYWAQYLTSNWKLGTAKLIEKCQKWFLYIAVTCEIPEPCADFEHVVGIDRGLRFLATTYDERGKTAFYSGHKVARKHKKYGKLRAQLQSKGTKSAKRVLKRISGRENRWMSDVNHRLTKTLVRKYGANTLFVLEDLTNIRAQNRSKEFNSQLNSWAFFEFEQMLAYKAQSIDSAVLKVSAAYTSQRCPRCGSIKKENRDHEHHEYCCKCGYHTNDDRNGAINIQLLGTMWVSGDKYPHFEKVESNCD